MKKEIVELTSKIEREISKTPTGELRNLLCDANIVIRELNSRVAIFSTSGFKSVVSKLNELTQENK